MKRHWMTTSQLVPFLAAGLAVGCGSAIPRAHAPEAPDTGQAKCSVAASSSNPLVTEWPASEKANLELRLRDGAVAVAYSGCELRLVPDCNLGGQYRWQRTTVSTDALEVRDADELYAKLPIGAAALEGELNQSGRLAVKTTVAGQMRLFGQAPPQAPQACWNATHVVSAMSVGAFTLRSGESQGARAGVDTPIGDVGAGTKSEESLMREAGDSARCSEATDAGAHAECRSPIQLFLTPIHAAPHAFAAPLPAAPTPVAPTQPAPTPDPKPPTPTADPTKPAPAVDPDDPTQPAPPVKPPETPPPAPPPAPPPTAEPWLPPAPAGPLGPAPAATGDGKPEDEEATVAINVTSADPDVTFVVNAGGKALCTTPCKSRVRASELVELKQIGDD